MCTQKNVPEATRENSRQGSKRAGILIRVSTEDQVRGESPGHHERRARLYAEAKSWRVIEVYRLDTVSGKTVKETPEAKQMLADIKHGHITGLIFSKLARLARNTKELLEFADLGEKYHPLAERKRQLQDEVLQVQAELDVLKISHISHEEIITGACDLYTRWPELPQEEKRRIVEAITDKIIIYEGEVEINLFYAPPTSVPPIGTPFTPQTPGSSTPPLPTLLNDSKRATLPVRRGCKGLKPQQHTQAGYPEGRGWG